MSLYRQRLGALAALWCVSTGCPPSPFIHAGPSARPGASGSPGDAASLLASALPAPRLDVDPPGMLAGRLATVTVVSHADDPVAGSHRLVVQTEGGDRVTIDYDLTPDLRIPAQPGERVRIRLYEDPSSAESRALVVAGEGGRALAVIARHDGLPPGVLPADTVISRSRGADHLAYTEVRALPSGCFARIAHHDLEVALEQPRRVRWVPPGTAREVTIAETPFLVVAYDAGVMADTGCEAPHVAHLSYALVAIRDAAALGTRGAGARSRP